ncbi:hypothetical protein LCGC14_3157140 [marine sediment metagenome]|uniref:LITAF domain-containing protein n=1 Tax=marine sediment metagenome TaxID=412755 RepID=A0A0F8YGT1_9ZZZZ
MAIKFCALCERNVEVKRKIGIGSLILILITAGFWILALPFYSKRCPICTSTALHNQRTN